MSEYPKEFPPQQQKEHPGKEYKMDPEPFYDAPWYKGAGKLKGKVAIITGGDSGIGRSVAILFAREGANVTVCYFSSEKDAKDTQKMVEKEGTECITVQADIQKKDECFKIVDETIKKWGRLDILVNNAAVQWEQKNIEDITEEQLDRTFKTNIYSQFYMTQASVKHMKEGSTIINTSSINAFKGHETLLDYTATKGAISAFTRGLAQNLAKKGIRVNSVAPGPIWTPLIPSSFDADHVKKFGQNTLIGRAGQPEECATCYVFLASRDSSYITGQTVHPNGGRIVNA